MPGRPLNAPCNNLGMPFKLFENACKPLEAAPNLPAPPALAVAKADDAALPPATTPVCRGFFKALLAFRLKSLNLFFSLLAKSLGVRPAKPPVGVLFFPPRNSGNSISNKLFFNLSIDSPRPKAVRACAAELAANPNETKEAMGFSKSKPAIAAVIPPTAAVADPRPSTNLFIFSTDFSRASSSFLFSVTTVAAPLPPRAASSTA